MKKPLKVLIGGLLVAAMIGPAASAMATSTYIGYNVNLPSAQQGVLAASQIKSKAATAGNLKVKSVGSTYKLNARQCRLDKAGGTTPHIVTCGTERFRLGDNSAATLPSGSRVASGKRAWLELRNSTWTLVRVQAVGSWRAN